MLMGTAGGEALQSEAITNRKATQSFQSVFGKASSKCTKWIHFPGNCHRGFSGLLDLRRRNML